MENKDIEELEANLIVLKVGEADRKFMRGWVSSRITQAREEGEDKALRSKFVQNKVKQAREGERERIYSDLHKMFISTIGFENKCVKLSKYLTTLKS